MDERIAKPKEVRRLAAPYRLNNKQIWNALKPVIIGAVGGGIVSFSASGCSSLTPSDKTQTMGVYAFGIPGIAVISQTTQAADNKGEDTNVPVQANPVDVGQ